MHKVMTNSSSDDINTYITVSVELVVSHGFDRPSLIRSSMTILWVCTCKYLAVKQGTCLAGAIAGRQAQVAS